MTDVVRTDTIVKFDTVCIVEPVATDSVVIRYKTRWLAVAEKPDTDVSGMVADEPYAEVQRIDAIGVEALVNDVVAMSNSLVSSRFNSSWLSRRLKILVMSIIV